MDHKTTVNSNIKANVNSGVVNEGGKEGSSATFETYQHSIFGVTENSPPTAAVVLLRHEAVQLLKEHRLSSQHAARLFSGGMGQFWLSKNVEEFASLMKEDHYIESFDPTIWGLDVEATNKLPPLVGALLSEGLIGAKQKKAPYSALGVSTRFDTARIAQYESSLAAIRFAFTRDEEKEG